MSGIALNALLDGKGGGGGGPDEDKGGGAPRKGIGGRGGGCAIFDKSLSSDHL